MTRSFLNIVTVDGKMCRVAEFGFFADSPSFDGDGIVFNRDGKYFRIDLDTGMLSAAKAPVAGSHTSGDGRYAVRLEFASATACHRGYVHMMLCDNQSGAKTVLTRFMGSDRSIGVSPFSADSKSIVFFGYPENELG